MDLKIFYHLFTENFWKEIFQFHLKSIIESELYNSIDSMTVNVIWKEEEDLQKTIDICEPYSKIKICNRNFSRNIPFGVNRNVTTKFEEHFEVQLAEAETILKTVNDAKVNRNKKINYLHLYSKGSSSQCISRQKRRKYEEVKNDPITTKTKRDLRVIRDFVFDWRRCTRKLKTHNWIGPKKQAPVYGTLINMWWATSCLLRKFDMQKFLKWQYHEMLRQGYKRPECRIQEINQYNELGEKVETFYNPTDRHAFTYFPYKVEQSLIKAQGTKL